MFVPLLSAACTRFGVRSARSSRGGTVACSRGRRWKRDANPGRDSYSKWENINAGRGWRFSSTSRGAFAHAACPGYRAAVFSSAYAKARKGNLPLSPFTVKALYLTEYGIASRALLDPALNIIAHGKANALVINIKSDRGLLPYPSEIPLATAIGARRLTTIRSLPDLVKSCHDRGIYMIARIFTFKDDPLATTRPSLAVHTAADALFKDREHLAWSDPFQAEVRAYNIAVAVEAAKAGFDEVQFDYVRFPDCATKLIVSCPVDQVSRVKALSTFLREARDALIPYNTFESIDIFGYVCWNTNDTGIGQQLEEITKIVDYVCLMLYP